MTSPFALPSGVRAPKIGYADIPPGTRHPKTGRYRMPLLPGDASPKSVPPGQDPWVSYGIQSMTNLAASISDTKALGIWETRQALIGIGLHPELAQELTIVVHRARAAGVDFQDLRSHPDFGAELDAMIERAKDISGANAARDAGIAMHDEWEMRGTGQQGGAFSAQLDQLEALLDAAGFDRVPELRERTVRNVTVNAAGRFDDILLHRRSGRLVMADLKSKRGAFWTWLEMDAQLAGYAYSEWMLETIETSPGVFEVTYVPGPKPLGVDLTEGIILHMPSGPDDEGKQEPRLRRADLVRGWRTLQLARQVCEVRSDGKSAVRERESYWPVG